jgi:TolA-binding protein
MASPYNASEPESPQDEQEEEIISTGFNALLFWDQYRQSILLGAGVLILAVVVFGVYMFNQSQKVAAAGAALASAATEDDFRAVIDKYPDTVAAGDASLILAGKLRADKKYDDSIQVLQTFLDKYPTHPLVAAGDLSIAETLETQGKMDDAMTRYQEVAAKYPDSYAAPVAVLDQANLLQYQGKIEDARRVFENFVAQFPDSIFVNQAMAEMHLLPPAPPSAAASSSPPPTPGNPEGLNMPNFMQPQAPASGSPAPK